MRWIFTTPLSPHQGGIYESFIKQAKRALRVTVGNQMHSWNEMSTVFAEVKSLINTHPLGYSSVDPNDPQPITPNHLLLGRTSPSVPQESFHVSCNPRKRFDFVQSIAQHSSFGDFYPRVCSYHAGRSGRPRGVRLQLVTCSSHRLQCSKQKMGSWIS